METIIYNNIKNNEYLKILNEILKKVDDNEIFFMDIYNYLEYVNNKRTMPFLLVDLEKLGITVIFNRISSESRNLNISK
jgi:hypothetical protein